MVIIDGPSERVGAKAVKKDKSAVKVEMVRGPNPISWFHVLLYG